MTQLPIFSTDACPSIDRLEQDRCTAIRDRDLVRLRSLLHPDLTYSLPTGVRVGRNILLDRIATAAPEYDQLDFVSHATVLLGDVALSIGTERNVRSVAGSPEIGEHIIVSTWIRDDDSWKLFTFQAKSVTPTPVAGSQPVNPATESPSPL